MPQKILQENLRQNPPSFIQQKSPTIFCKGARPTTVRKKKASVLKNLTVVRAAAVGMQITWVKVRLALLQIGKAPDTFKFCQHQRKGNNYNSFSDSARLVQTTKTPDPKNTKKSRNKCKVPHPGLGLKNTKKNPPPQKKRGPTMAMFVFFQFFFRAATWCEDFFWEIFSSLRDSGGSCGLYQTHRAAKLIRVARLQNEIAPDKC